MKYSIVYAMLLASIFTLIFVVTVISEDEYNGWIVSNDGNGDFSTIQSAVDAASSGDTIIIWDGIYTGTIFVNKSIQISGKNTSFCVIDGMSGEGIVINADNVVFSNCTIQNASHGIRLNGSNSIVRNCTIRDNDQGILIDYSADSTRIYHNNFVNNVQPNLDQGTDIYWNTSTSGNYWDTYDGVDNNHDDIGDIPFNITGDTKKDYYPLMKPVGIPPTVNFSFNPQLITAENEVVFTDTSIDTDGFIISYLWDFGDNTTSTQENPTHQFQNPGIYMVSLCITDNLGSTNKTSKNVTVFNVPPVAAFSFTPMNPTDIEQVFFEDTSYDTDGIIVNWTWDFGDNTSSFDQNPTYIFSDNGSFTVWLTVRDNYNDTSSIAHGISVSNVAPIASFSFTFSNVTALVDQPVFFQDTSVDLDGSIISREWYFGDNSNSSERSPDHTYSQKGSYTVSLTIMDNDGETATQTKQITVSDTIHQHEVISEFSLFDIVFIVFLVIMVILVIVLSKKYG